MSDFELRAIYGFFLEIRGWKAKMQAYSQSECYNCNTITN